MQNITGYTKVYGIIADPIRHSISPLMHNTAFGALGIDGVEVAFETPEEQFDAGVRGLKALGIQGFNVSMPYKRRIMDYLDEISPAARLAGAVNTVVREGDRYVGYLTDGTGFLQALATEGIDIAGKKLVILGKGGAATAISVQAALDGAAKITIFNRSDASENAELIRKATGCQAEAYSIADTTTLRQKLEEADLLVNATNVGMGNLQGQCLIPDASYLHHGLFVADIIYNPKKTALLAMAEPAGLPTANGLGMLLYQGAEAFRLWTGQDMPVDVVKRTAFPEL